MARKPAPKQTPEKTAEPKSADEIRRERGTA